MFASQQKAVNKHWKRGKIIAKMALRSKKMLSTQFSSILVDQLFTWFAIWSYSHWAILQEKCTEESGRLITTGFVQANDGGLSYT